ncbi:GNAT family N-acetyltransferase [Candidatus Micrarchaeota archaeon]|nr:GNAT family N-acetyltransferase [Candidatus Micrarchaeota archaeon]
MHELRKIFDRDEKSQSGVGRTTPSAQAGFGSKSISEKPRQLVEIRKYASFDEVDKTRLKELLERSFGKKLKDDYFEMKEPAVLEILIAGNYEGAAIVKKIGDVAYLDKIAVPAENQGKGIAKALMKEIKSSEYGQALIWRATHTNPINGWYVLQSDWQHKSEKWVIFGHGITQVQSGNVIEKIEVLEPTMITIAN